jgi:hypothetical protein
MRESEQSVIGKLPGFASLDNKKRNLILSKGIVQKIERDHGNIIFENLIISVNDWDYIIKNVDKNKDKINLIKLIPDSSNLFLVGANRINGYFMLTYYEIIGGKKDKLKSLLLRGDSLNNTGGAAVPSSATFP